MIECAEKSCQLHKSRTECDPICTEERKKRNIYFHKRTGAFEFVDYKLSIAMVTL